MTRSLPALRTYGHCGGCGMYVRWSPAAGRFVPSNSLTAEARRDTSLHCPGSFEWHWATLE